MGITRKLQVVILLGFGLFYVFMTPPFKAPDEISHLLRAYSIAEGQWILKDHPSTLVRFYLAEAEQWHLATPELRHSVQKLLDQSGDRVANLVFNTSLYSPVPYLLHALVIKAFMVFGQPDFLVLLYSLRFCSLLVFIGLLVLSFKIFPAGVWPIFWVAITPMALSQASVVNLDYLIFGATAVLLSASLGNPGSRLYSMCIMGSLILLMTSKLPYLPLLLVPVAAYVIRKNNKRLPGLVAGMVIALAAGGFWNYIVKVRGLFANSLHIAQKLFQLTVLLDPLQQLSFIVFSPWQYCRVLFTTFATHGLSVFHQFVGVLGELDLPIPLAAVILWAVGALVVISISKEPPGFSRRDSIRMGSCCLFAAITTTLTVLTSAFLLWMPVGATWINVQGRYFHPVAIVLLTGLVLVIPRTMKLKSTALTQFGLLFVAVMINLMALYVMFNLYGIRWSL